MKKKVQSLWLAGVLVLLVGTGLSLNAQQTPQTQPQDEQTQQPAQPNQPAQQNQPAPPNQTQNQDRQQQNADPQAQPGTAADVQNFTGTIMKSGDKYVFQEDTSNKVYDIDHQDEVQQFNGKKVRVRGTLDASGKMIHVQ